MWVRERHGAAEALACIERFFEMDDRMKNLTNFIKTVFKIEGNDAESAVKWYETWFEIIGSESTTLERSKTLWRNKMTKCLFKTGYKEEWYKDQRELWIEIEKETMKKVKNHKFFTWDDHVSNWLVY